MGQCWLKKTFPLPCLILCSVRNLPKKLSPSSHCMSKQLVLVYKYLPLNDYFQRYMFPVKCFNSKKTKKSTIVNFDHLCQIKNETPLYFVSWTRLWLPAASFCCYTCWQPKQLSLRLKSVECGSLTRLWYPAHSQTALCWFSTQSPALIFLRSSETFSSGI